MSCPHGTLIIESAYYGIHSAKSARDCCGKDPSLICCGLGKRRQSEVTDSVKKYCNKHGKLNEFKTMTSCTIPASKENDWNTENIVFQQFPLFYYWPSLKITFRCEDAETGFGMAPFKKLTPKESTRLLYP